MAEVLTPMRRQILEFIMSCQRERNFPPTIREIGDFVGLKSPATVANHIEVLKAAGYIEKNPQQPRTLTVRLDNEAASPDQHIRVVPFVGDVAAGTGVLAEESTHELMSIPELFSGRGDCFVLKVRGDSMVDAGILSGDYVVIAAPEGRAHRRDRPGRDPRRRGHDQALLPPGLARRAQARELVDGADGVRPPRRDGPRTRRLGDAPLLTAASQAPPAPSELVEFVARDELVAAVRQQRVPGAEVRRRHAQLGEGGDVGPAHLGPRRRPGATRQVGEALVPTSPAAPRAPSRRPRSRRRPPVRRPGRSAATRTPSRASGRAPRGGSACTRPRRERRWPPPRPRRAPPGAARCR